MKTPTDYRERIDKMTDELRRGKAFNPSQIFLYIIEVVLVTLLCLPFLIIIKISMWIVSFIIERTLGMGDTDVMEEQEHE